MFKSLQSQFLKKNKSYWVNFLTVLIAVSVLSVIFPVNFQSLKAVFAKSLVLVDEKASFSAIQENTLRPVIEPLFAKQSIRKTTVTITAYSSTVSQTDDTPFTTASGTRVRNGIVATNSLPFGTKIRIPSIFGNKVFVVEDRMNSRYKDNVDIWFSNYLEAKTFGVKTATIEILEN